MVKGPTLLFEPLPIARLGVRRDDDEVVMGTDFSSFGYVLEEFIALGIHKIAIPKSFPEMYALSSAPALLKQRISIIDDAVEVESADRLLHPIMNELQIEFDNETGYLKKPPYLTEKLFSAFRKTRRNILCMTLGLNNSVQIELDIGTARASTRALRECTRRPISRAILASIEGFFSYYEEVEFSAFTPPKNAPKAMVALFDRLMNDPQYTEYSEAVAMLSGVRQRSHALSRIREVGRAIASSEFAARGWNYVAKVINVWTGVPIPDSNTLSGLVSDKALPTIIDLQQARQRALGMWTSSADHDVPFNRSGSPLSKGVVDWLPPLDSMSAPRPGGTYHLLGTAGELLEQLEALMERRTTSD